MTIDPKLITILLSLLGVGVGTNSSIDLFRNGGGDVLQWVLALLAPGGITGMIVGLQWFKNLKPPTAAAAWTAALVLYKYFPPETAEAGQVKDLADKISEAMRPKLPAPVPPLKIFS